MGELPIVSAEQRLMGADSVPEVIAESTQRTASSRLLADDTYATETSFDGILHEQRFHIKNPAASFVIVNS